jgi:hypothetical protein
MVSERERKLDRSDGNRQGRGERKRERESESESERETVRGREGG